MKRKKDEKKNRTTTAKIVSFVLYKKKMYILLKKNGLEISILCYNICIVAFIDCDIFEAQ